MANFFPLKNYILYCIKRLIEQYKISPPFLDVGCGIGDVSQYVAAKGWQGKLIDISEAAIQEARKNLSVFSNIEIEKRSLFQENGNFKSIFFIDVLEHIDNDGAALEKISSLLSINGHLVMSVPSNPREWRWDDDFYGHYRRYTAEEIKTKLIAVRLKPLVFWDYTYPVFWMMRRIYTSFKPSPGDKGLDKLARSTASSLVNAWDMPFCSSFLSQKFILWDIIYKIQFKYFKDKLQKGHEIVILAEKVG